MTERDLDAIEAHAEDAKWLAVHWHSMPALAAEIRCLRKNIADAVDCLADMARNPEPGDSTRRRPRRCRLGCHCPKCTRVIG